MVKNYVTLIYLAIIHKYILKRKTNKTSLSY